MPGLEKDIITRIVSYCNRDLIPDESYNPNDLYPSDWFENYFSFVNKPKLQKQLGDAFYQARFMYKLMCALNFPLQKQRGIVKFQIIQYASICEAVLDTAITDFYKTEAEEEFGVVELHKENGIFAADVKLTKNGTVVYTCKEKKKKGVLKRTRVDFKTQFAVKKRLLSQSLKERLDILYELRNNVHILKAAEAEYNPKLREARDAFVLMMEVVAFVKQYYQNNATE